MFFDFLFELKTMNQLPLGSKHKMGTMIPPTRGNLKNAFELDVTRSS